MSKPTRRHHYCPAFYLANFAEPRQRDGRLYVLDLETGKGRPGTPDGEGHQRDFYRIEPKDSTTDPNYLEKEFEVVETGAGAAIKETIASGALPQDDTAFTFLINFLGLLAVRIPSKRERWSAFMESVGKRVLELTVSDRKIFETTAKRIGGTDVTYDQMKRFVDNDLYRIETHQNELILAMMQQAATLVDLLGQRRWHIVKAVGSERFVTSDDPVLLRWIKNDFGPYSPGFGLGNTEVTVALDPTTALVGVFEDYLKGQLRADDFMVRGFNAGVIGHAHRFVYGAHEDLHWLDDKGTARHWKDAVAVRGKREKS